MSPNSQPAEVQGASNGAPRVKVEEIDKTDHRQTTTIDFDVEAEILKHDQQLSYLHTISGSQSKLGEVEINLTEANDKHRIYDTKEAEVRAELIEKNTIYNTLAQIHADRAKAWIKSFGPHRVLIYDAVVLLSGDTGAAGGKITKDDVELFREATNYTKENTKLVEEKLQFFKMKVEICAIAAAHEDVISQIMDLQRHIVQLKKDKTKLMINLQSAIAAYQASSATKKLEISQQRVRGQEDKMMSLRMKLESAKEDKIELQERVLVLENGRKILVDDSTHQTKQLIDYGSKIDKLDALKRADAEKISQLEKLNETQKTHQLELQSTADELNRRLAACMPLALAGSHIRGRKLEWHIADTSSPDYSAIELGHVAAHYGMADSDAAMYHDGFDSARSDLGVYVSMYEVDPLLVWKLRDSKKLTSLLDWRCGMIEMHKPRKGSGLPGSFLNSEFYALHHQVLEDISPLVSAGSVEEITKYLTHSPRGKTSYDQLEGLYNLSRAEFQSSARR